MIPNGSQFDELRPAKLEPGFSRPELQEEIAETFLKLCDLLEQYSPGWYSDQLHEKAESVQRQIGR